MNPAVAHHDPIPRTPDPWGRRDLLIATLITLAATLFHLLYFNHGVRNWIDLGVAAVDGERILRGEHFGRDFMAPYGPGRYYLTALWFRFFGTSLFVLNTLYLSLMAVVAAGTYRVARYFVAPPAAVLAALLAAVAHGPIHKVYLGLFSVLFCLAALRVLERGSFRRALIMGAAGAVTGLFRHDLGALALICAGLVTIGSAACSPEGASPRHRWKHLVRLAAGCAAGGLVVLVLPVGLLMVYGDPLWVFDQVWHRICAFGSVSVNEPGLADLLAGGGRGGWLEGVLTLIFLATPFLILMLAGIDALAARTRARALELLLLAVMGLFLLNQWRLIPRFIRLMQVSPLLYVGMVVLSDRLGSFLAGRAIGFRSSHFVRRAGVPGVIVTLGLSAALVIDLWQFTGHQSQDSFAVLRFEEKYMEIERARCFVKKARCEEMEKVVAVVRRYSREGEPILTGPACPIVSFLAERPNAIPFTDAYLYFLNPDAEFKIIARLEEPGSAVSLFVDWPRPIGGLTLPGAAPRLHAYLRAHFRELERVGRFVIWRRP